VAVREVRYARVGTDGVMHEYARTRQLVIVRIKYSGSGARTVGIACEVGVADAGTNGR
jgi:hypothetical protein